MYFFYYGYCFFYYKLGCIGCGVFIVIVKMYIWREEVVF